MSNYPYNLNQQSIYPPTPIYETPPPPPPVDNIRDRERLIGQKIKKAFFITVLFIVFINSFSTLDKIYFLITQKQFDFITEETQEPTFKGYVASAVLVFFITLWIIWN